MSLFRTTVWGVMAVGLSISGCGDDSGAGPVKDAGAHGANDAAADGATGSVSCGTATCTVGEADVAWGAEACCVDAAASLCGVKSDKPVVMNPDGGVVSVGQALIELLSVAGDAGIVNTMPTLACVQKDAPGKRTADCPSETIDLTAAAGGDAGAEDAGPAQTYTVPGCCRDDGQCGYEDQATGLGCVKISQSFLGQVLGRADQSCSP
jgi:hypothetical protein